MKRPSVSVSPTDRMHGAALRLSKWLARKCKLRKQRAEEEEEVVLSRELTQLAPHAPLHPLQVERMKMRTDPRIVFRMIGDGAVEAAGAGVEVDSDLWSQLPDQIVLQVLTMLPRISQLRFRAVCKTWFFHLSNEDTPARRQGPLVCGYRLEDGVSGSLQADIQRASLIQKKGQTVFLYPPSESSAPHCFPRPPPRSGHELVKGYRLAAHDGLLSIETVVSDLSERFPFRFTVWLLNPITRTWRKRNRCAFDISCVSGLFKAEIATEDNNLKLLHACGRLKSRSLDTNRGSREIFKGVVYTMFGLDDGWVMEASNLETGWSETRTGAASILRCHLMERLGSLFSVGLCDRKGQLEFQVWRLDETCMDWEVISSSPPAIVAQLTALLASSQCNALDPSIFEGCVGAGDHILLTFRTAESVHVISFDTPLSSWNFCFSNEDPRELATLDGFFEPRLDVDLNQGHARVGQRCEWDDVGGYFDSGLL